MIKKIASGASLALLSMSAHAIVLHDTVPTEVADRVSIQFSQNAEQPICGGTMVTDRWVLTAAHCVVMTTDTGNMGNDSAYYVIPPGKLAVMAGTTDLNDTDVRYHYTVSHVVVHPRYTRVAKYRLSDNGSKEFVQFGLDNDIALLYLDRPVTGTQISDLASSEDMALIEPILESVWRDEFATNERVPNVDIFGWGMTEPMAAMPSPELLHTQVAFLPMTECYERLEQKNGYPGILNAPVNTSKICVMPTKADVLDEANRTKFGNSACNGDSGGPLVDSVSGKQIGIVSGAPLLVPSCGSLTIPSFFTRVDTYFDWIKGYIDADEPPASFIIEPNFITQAGDGTDEPCYDGIGTSNCDFRGEDDGGSLGFLGLGLLALMGWRRR